ncbi:hypothetical protein DFH07DRAFT_970850, partial [Mycena maculata]
LLGLIVDTGRDKFREDRHDEIHEYSKTLPATINAGGRFRKAEAELWAKEDQAAWDAAAASNEDVDWAERQKLVARGFEHLVNTLHASRRFRPFVATMLVGWLDERGRVQLEWAEGVPKDISVPQTFKNTHATLPLQDYMATLEDSAKGAVPVFPLTVEALDEITLKELTEVVASFLEASYEAAFGTREIPWVTIANEPGAYYDTAKFLFRFTSDGLAQLTRIERVELATALASDAGAGSSGFSFKAVPPPPPPPCPPRSPSPTPAEEREREAARLRPEAEEQEVEARLKREAEEREAEEREAHLKREVEEREREAARLRREAEEREARLRREAEEREARLRREAEEREVEEREREAERLGRETEEHEAEDRHAEEEANEVPPAQKKNGRKRKADTQLVPEDGVAAGRPSRTRKTPQEATRERAAKLVTAVRGARKPR